MNLDFISLSISSDEESPYFQCEVTLKDSTDYLRFQRDTPFTIHLFGIDYQFIVDSRTLNRTIDDQGNYEETCSFTGLSPLVRFSSPRAKKITQVWNLPCKASQLVQELIGSVIWNMVDWWIPAYRLAAESAAPLDIAAQIVTAAGGLIESQPDGSVVCRHRWPSPLADFEVASVDHCLYETHIFSSTESPTNDQLVNRVRILDQDSGYQDRMEYVPDKMEDGETDHPFHGTLYAYLSPWREGLRIVTTRPSVITLGQVSEGVRLIEDDPKSQPPKTAETITFTNGQGATQYPVMALTEVDWMDEELGAVIVAPYSTVLESGYGRYHGHSIAKISYTTRFLKIPVRCEESVETIEAQFLLLEDQ